MKESYRKHAVPNIFETVKKQEFWFEIYAGLGDDGPPQLIGANLSRVDAITLLSDPDKVLEAYDQSPVNQ